MPIFLFSFPFRWMVMERKNRLKIESVIVAAMLIKVKDRIKHSMIASIDSPSTKRLSIFFTGLIPLSVLNSNARRG